MFVSGHSQSPDCWVPRLSPRLFGEPTSRTRAWRILYNPNKMQWISVYTFSELVEILLLPMFTPLLVTPSVFLTASAAEIREHSRFMETLSDSQSSHLGKFQKMFPEKHYYDLASNPDHRRRTETTDGALMTLTTNSSIWWPGYRLIIMWFIISHACTWFFKNQFWHTLKLRSREKKRMLTAKELLATLGYPCRPATANQLQTESWQQYLVALTFWIPNVSVENNQIVLTSPSCDE